MLRCQAFYYLTFKTRLWYHSAMFKSDKLKQEIKSHNVSYAELDRRIGLGGKGVTSKYVNGVYDPKPTMLVKFLTALGWSDEQLQQTKLSDLFGDAV